MESGAATVGAHTEDDHIEARLAVFFVLGDVVRHAFVPRTKQVRILRGDILDVLLLDIPLEEGGLDLVLPWICDRSDVFFMNAHAADTIAVIGDAVRLVLLEIDVAFAVVGVVVLSKVLFPRSGKTRLKAEGHTPHGRETGSLLLVQLYMQVNVKHMHTFTRAALE